MTQRYDFLGECGGTYLETFATAYPAQYASELAALRGLDADEIIWEPAEGTVDGFDPYFPGILRTRTETRLNDELNAALTRIAALEMEVKNLSEARDFWYEAHRRMYEVKPK